MTKIPALHPTVRAWLLEGPLAAHVPAYVARLRRGRYATNTSGRCMSGVAHFAHWMSMCSLPANMLDEGCIDQFLRYHLPRCDCPGGPLRTPRELHAALVPMLAILRSAHVIAQPPTREGPIADELRSYDAYMRNARGLAAATRSGRLRIIERLLVKKFAGQPVAPGELQPDDIRRFIAEQLESLGTTSNAHAIVSTLRAYLRYRASCGDAVQSLLGVITSPAHWGMASLPRGLKPDEVERLLKSFTDALPSPRRGYAVVRLALDLGLRSLEINRLQLVDVDWRMGTVTLRHTKSRRQDTLPVARGHWTGVGGLPASRAPKDQRPSSVRAPHCTARQAHRRRCHPTRRARRLPARGHPARPRPCPAPHRGLPHRQPGRLNQGSGRRAALPVAEHLDDLRQA